MTTSTSSQLDAIVIGSGPNGLAAAITLAEAGKSVTVYEAANRVGGGVRSAELTLPGFVHDVCSAIYPFGRISPFFAREQPQLLDGGLRWIEPPYAIGHPLDDRPPVLLEKELEATAGRLGRDADAYRRLMAPITNHATELLPHMLAPFHVPLNPVTALRMAAFGLRAIGSATRVARGLRDEPARALFAGAAAHSILPLSERPSAAAGLLMLASAHIDGWPLVAGGAGGLSAGLARRLGNLGGSVVTGEPVDDLADLPPHRVVLFDTMPGHMLEISGDRLTGRYRRRLERYRHGPGIFKIDLALDGPIPWRDAELLQAGTVHLGGTFEEIAESESAVGHGRAPERPFVLLAQQSLFDPARAPAGKHTVWAYCHVPNGSHANMTEPILRQIERFAPGLRDRILATVTTGPEQLEDYNPNDVGGDIAGGRFDLGQLFNRPARPWNPYATPDPGIFICSSATPPGAGVHGMSGMHAAQAALRRLR